MKLDLKVNQMSKMCRYYVWHGYFGNKGNTNIIISQVILPIWFDLPRSFQTLK